MIGVLSFDALYINVILTCNVAKVEAS